MSGPSRASAFGWSAHAAPSLARATLAIGTGEAKALPLRPAVAPNGGVPQPTPGSEVSAHNLPARTTAVIAEQPAERSAQTVLPPAAAQPATGQAKAAPVPAPANPMPQAGSSPSPPRLVTGRILRERAPELAATAILAMPAAPTAAMPVIVQSDSAPQPAAAIAHIEALREAADAIDTSIRILPDALGAVDLSVRREGEITHVHLAAEQAQTQRLLADVQPRLAEFAEARGLKLQTSTGGAGGGGQPDSRPDAHARQQQPSAPPRARHRPDPLDQRIA